jgi:hypothetical protein
MSYNITAIDILKSEGLAIPRTLWRALALPTNGTTVDAPENSFLNPSWPQSADVEDVRGILFVKRLPWCGECSGMYWELFKELLAQFLGSADLVVTWEGGDSRTGVRLLNGKVTFHLVKLALGDEVRDG